MAFQNRKNRSLKFCLESLEERRLLAFGAFDWDPGAAWDPGAQDSGYWSDQVLNSAYFQNSQFTLEELTLEQFDSQVEAVDALQAIATEYWVDVLGQELDQTLWQSMQGDDRVGIFPIDSWFEPNDLNFITNRIDFGPARDPVDSSDLRLAEHYQIANLQAEDGAPQTLPFAVDDLAQESDLIGITDDDFMFLAGDEQVFVFDVSDASKIERVATIELGMFGRSDLFLTDQHLVSVNWNEVRIFDIADRSDPEFVSSMRMQQIVDSRLVGDSLFLTTSGYVDLPRPQFIEADWVNGDRVKLGEESIGRFETAEEYVSRIGESILAEFLPDVDISTGMLQAITKVDIGDWRDIVIGTEGFRSQQTNVLRIDLDATNGPQITESETVQGIHPSFMHFDSGGVYVVSHETQNRGFDIWPIVRPTFTSEVQSNILHFDFSEPASDLRDIVGGLDARHFAEVNGRVANANMLSSSSTGDLRVFSELVIRDSGSWDASVEANLSIFQSNNEHQLVEVSSLRDIADGQALYSGLFMGDKAFATTAEVVNDIPRIDPLHTFDLSDPLNPVEMSEIEIPGFTTQLIAASEDYLLGLGFSQDATGQWYRQVALYDIADLSSPSVVTNWVAPDPSSAIWLSDWLNAGNLPFDSETGHLIVPMQDETGFNWSNPGGAFFFAIETGESAGIQELGVLAPNTPVRRAEVFEGYVIVAGESQLQVYAVDQLDVPTQTILLGNPLEPDYFTVARGSQTALPVLDNDHLPDSATIVDVSNTVATNVVSIADDGRSLIYSANDTRSRADKLTYTVELEDGSRYSSTVAIAILAPQIPPQVNDGSVKLLLSAIDADGQQVSELNRGDRFWLEIAVDDTRDFDEGVFAAYVNLQFDTNVFEVVSDPENSEHFTNGIRYQTVASGINTLGGFSGQVSPRGPGVQSLVQIEFEALDSGDFEFMVSPSLEVGDEILLYGLDEPVALENVELASLQLNVVEVLPEEMADVNQDGGVTPQDALLIINYLNHMADQVRAGISTANLQADLDTNPEVRGMDISGDGHVTPLDVLLIANIINANVDSDSLNDQQAEGESIELPEEVLQVDTSELGRKRVWGGITKR